MNERYDDALVALRNANPRPTDDHGSNSPRVDEILSRISTTKSAEGTPPGHMPKLDDTNGPTRTMTIGLLPSRRLRRAVAYAAVVVLVTAVTVTLLVSNGMDETAVDPSTTLTTIGQEATSIPAPSTTSAAAEHPGDWLRLGGFSGYNPTGLHWEGVLWIENESSQTIVIDSGEFVFRSVTGAIIDTKSFSQRILYPGVNYLGVDVGPASLELIEVNPELIEVNYDEADFVDAGRFTISDVVFRGSTDGRLFPVSGEITSDFNQPKDIPELLVVFFDADGNPLSASAELLFEVRVEPGSTPFDFTADHGYDQVSERYRIEVHAHPSVFDPSPARDRIALTRSLSSTVEDPGEYPGDSLRLAGFSGYMNEDSLQSYWQGVVWVENASSETIVIDSGEFVFRSATGAVIDTDHFSQRILYPGINYVGVILFDKKATPESIEVNYHEAEFLDAGRFTISDVVVDPRGAGGGFRGAQFGVTSDFTDTKEFPEILFVFFDADGNPLFAQQAELYAVPPGTERFGIGISGDGDPAWDHVEVHVHPSIWDPSPSRDRIDSTRSRTIRMDSQ
jgi:hypothetical protein